MAGKVQEKGRSLSSLGQKGGSPADGPCPGLRERPRGRQKPQDQG